MIKDKDLSSTIRLYKSLSLAFKKKNNIQKFLNKKKIFDQKAIKFSYDLQSGSYIKKLTKFKKIDSQVFIFFNKVLKENFKNIKSLLDFGTGELTRYNYVIDSFKNKNKIAFFACDISLNRLYLGQKFFNKKFKKKKININLFVTDNFRIPLPDNSIDVVITCHAIEPNRKNMKKIIDELFRVSKKGLCLLEPHYEIANSFQKKRMDYYNYIKGLPKYLSYKKYDFKIIKKDFHINPQNPSSIFIIKKNAQKSKTGINYVDPISKKRLINLSNFLYCKETFRLFPVFDKISIFSNNSDLFLPKPD